MDRAFTELNQLEKQCHRLEQQMQQLQSQMTQNSDNHNCINDPELTALQLENSKLKYRIEILNQSIDNQLKMNSDGNAQNLNLNETNNDISKYMGMESLLHEIKSLFTIGITNAFPHVTNAPIVTKSERADYQCNSALQLSKIIGDKSLKPHDIAKRIIAHLPKNELIGETTIAGPGFINIVLNNDYVCKRVCDLIINGVTVRHKVDPNERIIVDYSSPNVAKEMHVGHLRSTIIGDSISNLFEFLGYDVLRINHIGDWGTQFGMLLAHLMEKYPNYLTNPPLISDLQAFYKEAKLRFDDDADFKKRAYNAVVRLQAKESDHYIAWQQICDISKKEFRHTYNMLGINKNLIERGESFYQNMMIDVVKDLEAKGLLEEDNGRKVMFRSDRTLTPLTIVKSDGGFTYDTSDMAALKQRVEQEKATRIIYHTDLGQAQHFHILFNCGALAGYYDPNKVRLDHVGFGVVLGEDRKKFKTRSGETVMLRNLLEEGLQRSLAKLIEKGRDKVLTAQELKAAQEAVAFGCIKYADLSHDRNHEYLFSFDRMLDDKGNTAVYLLYALTRIRSIIRNAKLEMSAEELAKRIPKLELSHPRELKLAKFILKFAEIILQIADELYLHILCGFLYDLSVVFSEFYDQCYCIEKITTDDGESYKVNINRILLCEATAKVMEKGLSLLGIKTVERM